MVAKKKRDLEKLLRDERKQEKERITEGDEFKDKDIFVTSAYRKQLEETVKFREQLEETDRIDGLSH
jgi:coiled-coil domain-containing protein 55